MSTQKIVFVTGGSRGLGLAIVKFLVEGTSSIIPSKVVTLQRTVSPSLQELAEKYDNLLIVTGDATKESDVEAARNAALERWGRIDSLVINAGVMEFALCSDMVRLTRERLTC